MITEKAASVSRSGFFNAFDPSPAMDLDIRL
jgi:hypothetical protein